MENSNVTPLVPKDKKEKEQTSLVSSLSPREIEVLKLLIEGKRNIEISASLKINQKTVNTYKTRLMRKLEVENPVDLFQQARNFDLI